MYFIIIGEDKDLLSKPPHFHPEADFFVNFVHGFGGFFLGFLIFVRRLAGKCPLFVR